MLFFTYKYKYTVHATYHVLKCFHSRYIVKFSFIIKKHDRYSRNILKDLKRHKKGDEGWGEIIEGEKEKEELNARGLVSV